MRLTIVANNHPTCVTIWPFEVSIIFNKWQLTSTSYLNPTWVTITLDHLKLIIIKKRSTPPKTNGWIPQMMGWKGNSLKNGKCSVGINVRFLGSKHPDNCHLSSWASKPWSSFVITVGSWRDPFIGLWNNPPKNWVVFHPRIFHPANQGEMITTHLLLTIIPKLSKLSVFFSFFSCTVFTYFFQQQKDFFLVWVD